MRIPLDMRKIPYIIMYAISVFGVGLICKKYGFGAVALCYAGLAVILTAAAAVDIRSQVIPGKLVLAGFLPGMAAMLANEEAVPAGSLLGCLLCGGILLLLSLLTKGGIGMGDAKLFAAAGLGLGMEGAVSALMLSAVFSGLAGLILIMVDRRNRKKVIPFAPFILFSVLIVLIM